MIHKNILLSQGSENGSVTKNLITNETINNTEYCTRHLYNASPISDSMCVVREDDYIRIYNQYNYKNILYEYNCRYKPLKILKDKIICSNSDSVDNILSTESAK